MNLICVGISYKQTPVELRDRCAFSSHKVREALPRLVQMDGVAEAVIISTCNRTEIYALCVPGTHSESVLVGFIAQEAGLLPCELLGYHYQHEGVNCVRHLFKVVCSLDSMVLGEAQILGQVRDALALAEESSSVHHVLRQLFQRSLTLGKEVRTSTQIGAHSVSISTAAITLVKRIFDSIESARIVVVGAGEMGRLTAHYLHDAGARHITVCSRTFEHAHALADELGAQADTLDSLQALLSTSDIVLCATASPSYVLTYDMVRRARKKQRDNSMLIMDIAIPRDCDPAINQLDDVYLFDVDDLKNVVEEGHKQREEAALQALRYVHEAVEDFLLWRQEEEVKPTIAEIRTKADAVVERELTHLYRVLKDLTPQEREAIEKFGNAVTNKLLHGPFARLRKGANDPDSYVYTEAARFLFGLDSVPDGRLNAQQRRTMLNQRRERERGVQSDKKTGDERL